MPRIPESVDVLHRGLDELPPPQTRKLLADIQRMVRERAHIFGLEEIDVRCTSAMCASAAAWATPR